MVAALIAASLVAAGCGSDSSSPDDGRQRSTSISAGEERLAEIRAGLTESSPLIRGVQELEVGEGSRGAVVLWNEDLPEPPRDVVLFLHAWSPLMSAPPIYGEWLGHLAAQGSTVLFPTYLPPDLDPRAAAENVLAGVAAGLNALGSDPDSLVAAGHTTGGALAFDYAAGAAADELPQPDAIFALYPGRNPDKVIPAIDPTQIAPHTRIAVLSGEGNPVVRGEEQAQALLRSAERVPRHHRRFVDVDPAAGPIESDARTRRAIWRPLDRLIAQARRAAHTRG